jgi:hypothetical protein
MSWLHEGAIYQTQTIESFLTCQSIASITQNMAETQKQHIRDPEVLRDVYVVSNLPADEVPTRLWGAIQKAHCISVSRQIETGRPISLNRREHKNAEGVARRITQSGALQSYINRRTDPNHQDANRRRHKTQDFYRHPQVTAIFMRGEDEDELIGSLMTTRRMSPDESAPLRPAAMWPYMMPNYSCKDEIVVSDVVGAPLVAISGLIHALSESRPNEMVAMDRVTGDPASVDMIGFMGITLGLQFSSLGRTRGIPGYPDGLGLGHFTGTVGRIRHLVLLDPEQRTAIESVDVQHTVPGQYLIAA